VALFFRVPSPLDEWRPLFSNRFVVDETKRNETRRNNLLKFAKWMTDERTGQSPKPIPCDAMRYDPIQIRDSDPDPKRETHVATTRSSHDMYIHICMCLYEIKMGRDEVVWNGRGGALIVAIV